MANYHRIVLLESAEAPNTEAFSFEASEHETILHAALAHGVDWPHRCQRGGCLSCVVRCRSGEWDYPTLEPALTEREQEQGWLLACIAQPRSCLVIELESSEDA